MAPAHTVVHYDGVCVNITIFIKPTITGKSILTLLNGLLISIIILFVRESIPLAAISFLVLEFLLLRYTLWNLFGEERIILNSKSLNYQHHYGFFTGNLTTVPLLKRMYIIPFNLHNEKGLEYLNVVFQSFDENNLPNQIYYTALRMSQQELKKVRNILDLLYLEEMNLDYHLPEIHMN